MAEMQCVRAGCGIIGCTVVAIGVGRQRGWCSTEHWLADEPMTPHDPYAECRCTKYRPGKVCCAYRKKTQAKEPAP